VKRKMVEQTKIWHNYESITDHMPIKAAIKFSVEANKSADEAPNLSQSRTQHRPKDGCTQRSQDFNDVFCGPRLKCPVRCATVHGMVYVKAGLQHLIRTSVARRFLDGRSQMYSEQVPKLHSLHCGRCRDHSPSRRPK
jgi:hypothetical protein